MSENIEINFVGDGFPEIHNQLNRVEQRAQQVGRIPFAFTTTGTPAPGSRAATAAGAAGATPPAPANRTTDRATATESRQRTAETRDDTRYASQLQQVRDERIRLESAVNRSIERELRDRIRAEPAQRRYQPTERGMTDSRRAMAAATEFQSQIAGLSPSDRLAAIRQRISVLGDNGRAPPGPEDPAYGEFHRLQRQAASTERTTARGRFLAAPSGARMAAIGAFAVHEVVGALQDQIRAGHQLQLAGNRREYMTALADQARAGWSGPIAGTIGGVMDLFGAGPESAAFRIESQGRSMEAQQARMAAAISLQAERSARQYNRGGRVGAIKYEAELRKGQLLNEMSANKSEQDDLVRRLGEKEKYLEFSTNPAAVIAGPLGLLANSQVAERDKVRGDARTALEERLKELRTKQTSNIENADQLAKEEAEAIELYRRNVKSNVRASQHRAKGNNFGAKIEELNFGLFSAMYRGDAEGTQEAVQNFREFLATTKRDNYRARTDVNDAAMINRLNTRGFDLLAAVAGVNVNRRQALRDLPNDPLFNQLGGQALRDAINAGSDSQIDDIREEFAAGTRRRFMTASGRGYEGKMQDVGRRLRKLYETPLSDKFTEADRRSQRDSLLEEVFKAELQRQEQGNDIRHSQAFQNLQLDIATDRSREGRNLAGPRMQIAGIAEDARGDEINLRRRRFDPEADEALNLGRRRLDAYGQNFFDTLQTESFNPFLDPFSPSNPKLTTNPAKLLQEIETAKDSLTEPSTPEADTITQQDLYQAILQAGKELLPDLAQLLANTQKKGQ